LAAALKCVAAFFVPKNGATQFKFCVLLCFVILVAKDLVTNNLAKPMLLLFDFKERIYML
jgi:hypothetical protein